MNIQIHPPVLLNQKGKRDYNQDTVHPAVSSTESVSRFYMVCDGVGGSSRGDVASSSICEAFSEHFSDHSDFSQKELQNALDRAVQKMRTFIAAKNEGESMASTLTFTGFNESGVVLGHVGDSRIYHVRNGRILHKTRDHSLMNEWIDQGVIQPDEVASHPKRNVVTRAVVASDKKIEIERYSTADVQVNDIFFLCSDGVLEAFSDEDLIHLLSSGEPEARIMASVDEGCKAHSKDNYSAYLIRVKSVEASTTTASPVPVRLNKDKRLFWGTATFVTLFLIILFASIDWAEPGQSMDTEDESGIESSLEELRKLDTLSIEPTDHYDDTPPN